MNTTENRRNFLKLGIGATGALAFLSPISKAIAGACGVTPAQTPGPFYPGESQFHPINDLIIDGKTKGQIIQIQGQVMGADCQPVSGALVEIWQACASGRYNNSTDTNPAPLDQNFKYWGENVTDANGLYNFRTIIPGAYPADTNWVRPPHIHFKISKLGYKELVTQMYFKGNALNDSDLILRDVPEDQHESVIVDFQLGELSNVLFGTFNITLQPVSR